jgi:hypothetical protein
VLLTLVASQQGSRAVLIERAYMGFGDGEPGGEHEVNLAIGRALVLPQPAKVYEHSIAICGAGRREALGLSREQTHARARTRGPRAVAWSRGHGEEAIERLHSLIPRKVVPRNQEVTAVEAGQQFRVINATLFGV